MIVSDWNTSRGLSSASSFSSVATSAARSCRRRPERQPRARAMQRAMTPREQRGQTRMKRFHRACASRVGRCSPSLADAPCNAMTSSSLVWRNAASIDMWKIGRGDDRLEPLRSGCVTISSSLPSTALSAAGENRVIGEIDAGDVVAHVVERGAADA